MDTKDLHDTDPHFLAIHYHAKCRLQ